jgi:DNA (cytosine-5)-methyltransferase 1
MDILKFVGSKKSSKKASRKRKKKVKLKFIDLFCGIGSFHNSFAKLGWECILASDICEPARKTYKHNHKLEPKGDICEIDPSKLKSYDVLTAGFPCQPFSQAGYRKGFKDEKDSRGTMFSQVMKFVKINKPRIIVLENVAHLLKHDGGKSFERIKKEIGDEGYSITYKVLKCSDYGIPQMRKRLFIVGMKNVDENKLNDFFDLAEYEKKVTMGEYLGKEFEKDTAYTIRCGGRRSPIDDRHNWDGYWVKNNDNREEYRLTIEDALKLQGFENYELQGTNTDNWKMLGNTIPTIFTEIIGKQILKML